MSTKKKPEQGGDFTAEEEAFYAAWAERIEADDYGPIGDGPAPEIAGDPDEVFAQLEAAANRGGRPALDGPAGAGESPVRRFRLPRELDAELTARAEREHRKPSAIMRDALADYLSKAS